MNTKLVKYSLTELRQLADDVKLELDRRHQQRIADARNQVYAIAKNLGLTVHDLLGKHSKDVEENEQIASKYRNPEDHQHVWTGRGRRPHWVTAWLESGKPLADLALETAKRRPYQSERADGYTAR